MRSLETIAASLSGYDPQDLHADIASQFLRAVVEPLHAPQSLALHNALDRVLAQDIISSIDVPAHDNAAMDGYAFDGAGSDPAQACHLSIVGTALAGRSWAGMAQPGECVRIMTGAVMPAGMDTVVPQERVSVAADRVLLPAGSWQRGDNRRLRGEDLRQQQIALSAGTRIGPAALGLLASLGLAQVPVQRPLRVAFFSTGDEILRPGEPPRDGAVYDSNRYTLLGMLARMGVQAVDLGVIPDDPQALRSAFTHAAAQADAIITSGGVSAGEADHTKTVMREMAGGDAGLAFWKLAIRPGRPMANGRLGKA